jgi:L-ascorbate metabolism protein UlaG (beta-lactamase superfamily)
LTAPAVSVEQLGHIDAVLLSHDQHEDNLDRAGRAFLPRARQVITTVSGAKRLGSDSLGLANWSSTVLNCDDVQLKITAVPARHGPWISQPFVGDVIGFVLEWTNQKYGALYISGDTVWFNGVAQVAKKFRIGTAILHFGGVQFPLFGPLRLTMNAAEGVRVARATNAHTIVPIHYEGWAHFREPKSEIEKQFASAKLSERLCWLPLGIPTELDV